MAQRSRLHIVSLFGLLFCLLVGCDRESHDLPGFVDADLIAVSSPVGGRLMILGAQRGQHVKPHQVLYQLDDQPESAELKQSQAALSEAQAHLKDLQQGARRPVIDRLQAAVVQANADAQLALKRIHRAKALLVAGAITQDRFDADQRNYQAAHAKLEQARLQVADAMLGGRQQAIQAAASHVQSLAAAMHEAQWRLSQKTVESAVDAQVEETYYTAGEYVAANHPVMSLLLPKDKYVVFYLPLSMLPGVQVGDSVVIDCEGCQPSEAEVRYLSPKAEYTPPVVYTSDNPHQLVYQVKANFIKQTGEWHPGQPVTVHVTPHLR